MYPSSDAQKTQYPVSANRSLLILDDSSSVEKVDLFNNLQNVVITNADKDVWQQIGKVNLNADSSNPGAPEHLVMVNHILGDNANKKPIWGHTSWKRISTTVSRTTGACAHIVASDDALLLSMWHDKPSSF